MNLANYKCEGQMSIFDLPQFQEARTPAEIWADETGVSDYWQHDIKFVNDKPVCKHSGHTCNRIELWKVANTLDDITCPEKCCRQCFVKSCGARCNGSEEPKVQQCAKREECEAYGFGCGGTVDPCRFGGPYKWSTKEVDIRGICDDGYCPTCGLPLDDLVDECSECHTKLDWSRWKILNEVK